MLSHSWLCELLSAEKWYKNQDYSLKKKKSLFVNIFFNLFILYYKSVEFQNVIFW